MSEGRPTEGRTQSRFYQDHLLSCRSEVVHKGPPECLLQSSEVRRVGFPRRLVDPEQFFLLSSQERRDRSH
jgi:hypothetical protein